MAVNRFGDLVKAVVDIERGIMAVDAELHADEEALLLENGSLQNNLWGINIYPELGAADRIEFDSMINIRPSQGNRSRGVKGRAFGSPLARGLYPRASTAEVDPRAKPGAPVAVDDPAVRAAITNVVVRLIGS